MRNTSTTCKTERHVDPTIQSLSIKAILISIVLHVSACGGNGEVTSHGAPIPPDDAIADLHAPLEAEQDSDALEIGEARSAEELDYISLSPRRIKNGQLPSGYKTIDFTSSNGNYTANIHLPETPVEGATINLTHDAEYSSNVIISNSDLPINKVNMGKGDEESFKFITQLGGWTLLGDHWTPRSVGNELPTPTSLYTTYATSNGNWASKITLPKTAKSTSLLEIRVRSTWAVHLDTQNLENFGNRPIRYGQSVFALFNQNLKKWIILASPKSTFEASTLTQNNLPIPQYSNTIVRITDQNWRGQINLPEFGYKGDRIALTSSAAQPVKIGNTHVASSATLQLGAGDTYIFLYNEDKALWIPHSYPVREYGLSQSGENITTTSSPLTRILINDNNWRQSFELPGSAQVGDRVIFESSATQSTQIQNSNSGEPYVMDGIGKVEFTYTNNNIWKKTSNTIDILFVMESKAVEALGESAMRARMTEGLSKTNDALENSGANFNFRQVGNMTKTFNRWVTDLGHVLRIAQFDSEITNERKRLKADAVYIEGKLTGCGLAWMPRPTSYRTMIGSGSLNCGTSVMRHELGHNMGLSHADPNDNFHGKGYSAVKSIMGGNQIPFYSNTTKYTDHGIAMGIEGQIDAVNYMNTMSERVSNFHR